MLKEFRDFAMKGNVIDLAIGVIIGGAFGKIVTSLVNDVLMPPIGMIMGQVDFSGVVVGPVKIGLFINSVIDFLIVAFVIFFTIRQLNRFKKAEPAPGPSAQEALLAEIRDLLKAQAKK